MPCVWSVIFDHIHLFLFQDYVVRVYFFMLKSTEHELSTKMQNIKTLFFIFKLSAVAFIMLMNVKLPTIAIMLIITLVNVYVDFKYSVCAWRFMLAFRNRFEYRSSRSVLESIPKCVHNSPCACRILKMI